MVRVDGRQLLAADAPQHEGRLVGAGHDEAAGAGEAQPDDVRVVPLGEAHHRLKVDRVVIMLCQFVIFHSHWQNKVDSNMTDILSFL